MLHDSVRRGLAVFTLLLFVLLWGGLVLFLQHDRAATLANANRNGDNLSRAFAEHITGIFRSIDQTLLGMVQEYRLAPERFDPSAAERNHFVLPDATVQVGVVGPDGYLRSTSYPDVAGPLYLGDREYFQAHVAADTGRMFISRPLLGRVSGLWLIHFSRRIDNPDGSFGGVIMVSIDPRYISNFYKTIDIGPHGFIAVVGLDQVLRARADGQGRTDLGYDLSKAGLWPHLAQSRNGCFEEAAVVDGRIRLFNYRSLADYPMVVDVGLARDDVLAAYRDRRVMLIAAAVAISVVLALALGLLMRQASLQVATEAALRRREQELMASRNEANLANRAKSEFLANMSHELRTPLNAIIGFSDIIMSGVLGPTGSPKYLEYARDIHRSGKHLLDMIAGILDMSKIEAGRYELTLAEVELAPIVTFCLRLVGDRAARERVSLESDLPPDLPKLRADERAARQILLNLLSNAVKFTPAGGRVRVAAALDGHAMVRLAVSDTGIGIAAEDIPTVLEPFRQVGRPLHRSQEGTGLGLAITKRLVELHGGGLAIASPPGQGTTVTVTLPTAAVSRAAAVG